VLDPEENFGQTGRDEKWIGAAHQDTAISLGVSHQITNAARQLVNMREFHLWHKLAQNF